MEPAGPVRKNGVPIEIAGLELGSSGVGSIRAADGGAHSEPSLGEIQSIPHGSSDAVIFDPAHQRLIDAALIHQILNEAAYRIIGERGDDGGIHAKAAFEAARDVVFAAAFVGFEVARSGGAAVAG